MDRMTSLRVFREVVESGSFTAAAARSTCSTLPKRPSGKRAPHREVI